MENINLYVYWYGNEEIKKEIELKFNNLAKEYQNINLIIGPTPEEHQYLMQNIPYYKEMTENKKYGFTADVYRFWKLSNSEGIYIDALTEINVKRFIEFIDLYLKNKNIFIKENGHLIWNGIIASHNKKLFENIFNFYKKNKKIIKKLTGPVIISNFIYRFYGVKRKNIDNELFFLDARDIKPYDKNSLFNYNGVGSWGNNRKIDFTNRERTGAHEYFAKNANKFHKGYSKLWIIVRWLMKHCLFWLK